MNFLQVTHIRKIPAMDRYKAIEALRGLGPNGVWEYTQSQVIQFIKNGVGFFTNVNNAAATVVVHQHLGHPYLATDRDGLLCDNLLSLPQF